jgi:hypothetical protein
MDGWRRQAIYFAPPAGSELARFGAGWLGWDAEAGTAVDGPAVPGRAALVAAPRRYGFHATLKPPFRLADGVDAAGLDAGVAAVATGFARFRIRLGLGWLAGFLALLPAGEAPEAAALAAACVTGLDRFRAPPDAAELARRGVGLDAVEAANLARWGYPWVLGRFRFHMTLTGPVPEAGRAAVEADLAPRVAPLVAGPVPVSEICRFGEGADGMFRLIRRYPLG